MKLGDIIDKINTKIKEEKTKKVNQEELKKIKDEIAYYKDQFEWVKELEEEDRKNSQNPDTYSLKKNFIKNYRETIKKNLEKWQAKLNEFNGKAL